MAIPGDFVWDKTKYAINNTPLEATTTDWAAFAAERWHELVGVAADSLKAAFASLSEADLKKLMTPGFYPAVTGDAGSGFTVTVMAGNKFPNVINFSGKEKSPDGELGLPERNQFGGESVSVPDPAI